MKFYINPKYITEYIVCEIHHIQQQAGEDDADFIIRKLKSDLTPVGSTRSIDHPKFTMLRNKLEDGGYIETQRGWWNGDIVLKSFVLNDMKFKKGDVFWCGSALGIQLAQHSKM